MVSVKHYATQRFAEPDMNAIMNGAKEQSSATISSSSLPGNPLAIVTCFRFFVEHISNFSKNSLGRFQRKSGSEPRGQLKVHR